MFVICSREQKTRENCEKFWWVNETFNESGWKFSTEPQI